MRTLNALLAASFLTTVTWTADAWARRPAPDNGPAGPTAADHDRRPPPLDELLADHAQDLGLDATTLDTVLAIVDAHADTLESLQQQGRDAHEAIMEEQRAVMDEIAAVLSDSQLEALHELLPPPPGCDGPPTGRDGPPPAE